MPVSDPVPVSYQYILGKAWPIILANAAVPLLGLVDTAVIGNVGNVQDLGAIAFGALIFSFVYWSFGFLRMGTTGFAAQAVGAGDETEIRAVLGRSLLLATTLGLALIALQWPIGLAAFSLLSGSEPVELLAQQYFAIRIWGAPATLTMFALMGLLIGLGNSKQLLAVQVFLNTLNMVLDVIFAGVLGWGVSGIALGTVLAEWCAVFFAAWLLLRELRQRQGHSGNFWPIALICNRAALMKTLQANADIMIRTLLLVFSFAFFINQSARYGEEVLAASHILLQLIAFAAFFLDGYAFVVESLVGSAIGARQNERFNLAVIRSSILAGITASILALGVWVFGSFLVSLLTDLPEVRIATGDMLFLAAIYIFFSFAAFQLDGIFIGASRTAAMRNAAFISLAVFFVATWVLTPRFGVSGLWWAMIIYVAARADALLIYFPSLRKSVSA